MSTNSKTIITKEENKILDRIVSLKKPTVNYMTWLEAYKSLTDIEAANQDKFYISLANLVVETDINYGEVDPRDAELLDFLEKRKKYVAKVKSSLKSFIELSEQWSLNSLDIVKQNAALCALLISRGTNELTKDMKERLLEYAELYAISYADGHAKNQYDSPDDYTNAKNMFIDSYVGRYEIFVNEKKVVCYQLYGISHYGKRFRLGTQGEIREQSAEIIGFGRGSYVKAQ